MQKAKKKKKKKRKKKKKKKETEYKGEVMFVILTRIVILKSPKKNWDYLKGEYEGNEKI